MKVLFVCLGNICRSPLAHAILDDLAKKHSLDWEVDSAGTSDWHIGEKPDPRSQDVALKHGIDLNYQRARQFSKSDFKNFDLIYCMDQNNLSDVLSMSSDYDEASRVKLILDELGTNQKSVEDPYYNNRFSEVYLQLEQACMAIIEKYAE